MFGGRHNGRGSGGGLGGVGPERTARLGALKLAWCGDLVTVGGTGLVEGEGEVRWKESHRQDGQDSIGRVARGDPY